MFIIECHVRAACSDSPLTTVASTPRDGRDTGSEAFGHHLSKLKRPLARLGEPEHYSVDANPCANRATTSQQPPQTRVHQDESS